MMRFIKRNWKLLCICLVSLIMFFPSLFAFYTNDDFFFLKIANVLSVKDFLNFFNLVKDVGGIGVYRPLTLRVFYFLTVEFFHFSPLPLHIISFATFFLDIFLVAELTKLLTKSNKIALISSFLYATSVTHFGQLYYAGMFQELCLTLFFLASTIIFAGYEMETKKRKMITKLIWSFLFFVLAILCKETAVVLPAALVLIHFYLKVQKRTMVTIRTLVFVLSPFAVVLAVYLFLHFHYFGLISGDSYVWDFSIKKFINSIMWYLLWSLNIPESLVDFVGPGLHVNPNLFIYWSREIIPIFILFMLQCLILCWIYVKDLLQMANEKIKKVDYISIFCIAWFVITILPVIFLPIHKFTFYLTLPLIGIAIRIGDLFVQSKINKIVIWTFLILWTATSVLTLRFTYDTNWISQSELVASRVYQYFKTNNQNLLGKNIYFIDTINDSTLPWSPTATLKTVLSDNNFFDVFYPDLSAKVNYTGLAKPSFKPGTEIIGSRQFLGY